jgi:DNA repair protein RadC
MKMSEDEIVSRAIEICTRRLQREAFTSPSDVKRLARLHLGREQVEKLCMVWLDGQNHLIEFEVVSKGTVNSCFAHPREVVRSAIAKNAVAAILVHNHPSGQAAFSEADKELTRAVKDALALVDCKLLDHVLVASVDLSMAEIGLI